MRHAARRCLATGLLVVAIGCQNQSQAPRSVVAVTPTTGSVLASKCPVKVQFSETVEVGTMKTGGTIQPTGQVTGVWKQTALPSDTVELFPPWGEWKLGAGTFSFTLSEVFGREVSGSLSYTVEDSVDENWVRPQAHQTGRFVQGIVTDLWFASASIGYAVGRSGMVMKTIDGGTSWAQLQGDRTQMWVAIWGSDAQNVWMIGANGRIRKTSDGGATFKDLVTIPTLIHSGATELLGVGGNLYIASRHVILRSTDGGSTWQAVANDTTQTFLDLYFPAPNNLFALTVTGRLYRSTDGITWTFTEMNLPGSVYGLTGDGAGKLWAAGAEHLLAVSTNSGTTWTVQKHERGNLEHYADLWAADGNRVWAAGHLGGIARTEDGGATWKLEQKFPSGLTAMFGLSTTNVWVAGEHGLVGETENGADWVARTDGSSHDMTGVWVRDSSKVTAIGKKGFVVTTSDAGATWTKRDSGTTTDLNDIWGIGAERWVTDLEGTVYYSSDDGAPWSKKSSVTGPIRAIFGSDRNNLWLAGGHCPLVAGDVIFRSTNGGDSWESAVVDNLYCTTDLWAADANHVFAAGHAASTNLPDAAVFSSADGGKTWTQSTVGKGTLSGIWGTDTNNLWVVGQRKTVTDAESLVARTTNGGESWSREFPGFGFSLDDVWMAGPDQAWGIGGSQGPDMFSTDNGCRSPALQPSVGTEVYAGIHGTADGKRIWVVGHGGLIARLDRP